MTSPGDLGTGESYSDRVGGFQTQTEHGDDVETEETSARKRETKSVDKHSGDFKKKGNPSMMPLGKKVNLDIFSIGSIKQSLKKKGPTYNSASNLAKPKTPNPPERGKDIRNALASIKSEAMRGFP